MSLPLKAGVATLAISTIGGISTGLGAYFGTNGKTIKKGPSISDLIEEQYEYILLDTEGNDSAWEKILSKYQKENKIKEIGKDTLQLAGWPVESDDKLIKQLKQKCKLLSKENETNIKSNLYKNLTSYCARGVTFEEKALWEGLIIADTNGDANIWEDRQKYSSSTLYEDLTRLGSAGVQVVVNREGIKKGCENARAQNKQARGNNAVYLSYKKVCTKGKKTK